MAHPWAVKYGIEDDEAMERIKWGIQLFQGTIQSVTNIKKRPAKTAGNPNEEVVICIVPNS